ncbi:M48 family metallopeptidase [Shewanella sp. 1_MG-2023]|uniref:M48 family metallopeptidase n=1 Tax=unclassified Shewanella TaxID=196818 RepID=UPI000C846112|nr:MULTISPECIES: M48 family metallopeptidase [unclassified Shewanella]MDO6610351.1 M48 family metallopeptidase [Shewanella sp. 7_MG-2023]MDO6770476.1 M48 family metallopeptidase [Shewanella sp. 2_MG-2023]MDO6794363.1 M48 family metallopeptidase [Shewanella sp. 1_MG-2023]PMG78754.1 Zn-dependent protease [Shewanella sp. 10N.286.51.B7]
MKKLVLTLLLPVLLAGCATTKSPTGRSQVLLFDKTQMTEMGGQSFAAMKKEQKVSTDKQKIAYVSCIADRITAELPDQSLQWEVVVFDSEQVNAFALPGGHIGVYTGLLTVASDEDQLATVIGHEVAHVLARHGNEQVSRAQMTNTGMQLADVALGAGGVSNKDMYMAGLGLGAQVGILLPFGRDQESEADELGLELMAKAGFNPAKSVILWQNMAKAGGEQGPELFSTHPSHSSRISDLQALQTKVTPLYQAAKKQSPTQCKKG